MAEWSDAAIQRLVDASCDEERRSIVKFLREHGDGFSHAARLKDDHVSREVADQLYAKATKIERGEHIK